MIGYSFGTLIAIELARRLEAEGFTGQLILIDGSPDYLKEIMDQQILFGNSQDVENKSIMGIMNNVHPENSSQVN